MGYIAFRKPPPINPAPTSVTKKGTVTRTEGPRIGSLTTSNSAYGEPIKLLYGTMKVGTNIIYAGPIVEQKAVTTKTSGLDKEITTSYNYYGTFAAMMCIGPITDVIRIWADGRLIFDKTGTNPDVAIPGLVFRLYKGNTTQLPDPIIEQEFGVGNVPAFRGRAYIVFERFPLSEFNNGIPPIEVEVVAGDYTERVQVVGTPLAGSTIDFDDDDWFAVDWERGYAWYAAFTPSGGLARVDIVTGQQDRELDTLTALDQVVGGDVRPNGSGSMVATPRGDLVMSVGDGQNAGPIVLVDGDTLREKARFGSKGSDLDYDETRFHMSNQIVIFSTYSNYVRRDYALCCNKNDSDFGILEVTPNSLIYTFADNDTITDDEMLAVAGRDSGFGEGEAWILGTPDYSGAELTDLNLYRLGVTPTAANGDGITFELNTAINPDDLVPGTAGLTGVQGFSYDPSDNTFLIWCTDANGAYVIKWQPQINFGSVVLNGGFVQNAGVVWRTGDLGIPFDGSNHFHMNRLGNHTVGWHYGDNGVLIDTIHGEVLFNQELPNWADAEGTGTVGAYDSFSGSFVTFIDEPGQGPANRMFFNRGAAVAEPLQDIVQDLCERSGLVFADIDVVGLAGVNVPGYAIGDMSTARGAIQPLADLYLFDTFESDHQLQFKLRGGSTVANIPEVDMGIVDRNNGDVIIEEREQEVELPERYTIGFVDPNFDYLGQTQFSKRNLEPNPAMRSNNQNILDVPVAMSPTTAKQQAEKSLYSIWRERDKYEFKLGWKYLTLDPSDSVELTLADGTIFRTRITESEIGAGLAMNIDGVSETSGQYVSTAVGYGGSGYREQIIQSTYLVKSFVVDVPLLNDAFSQNREAAVYPVFASGFRDGAFRSAYVYDNLDGGNFALVDKIVDPTGYGSVTTIFPDPPGGNPHATDNVSTLTVAMSVGTPQSITYDQMVNGGNQALIIKANGEVEVIHFQNVTDNGDGTYTLDTFMRGRRGTDTMSFGHTFNETFILVSLPESLAVLQPISANDTDVAYKVVGEGQIFQDGEDHEFTAMHRSLMPYAPVHVTATEDGSNNIDFEWVRRDRLFSDLIDLTGDIALSEDSEEYELEIYDMPGGTILRTITGLTTNAYEYPNADVVTDFGSVPAEITVRVYQISAQVGRGFSYEVTIDVN